MRRRTLLTLASLAGVLTSTGMAQQPKVPASRAPQASEMSTMIEQLVQAVFTSADTNRNRYLSKREFENADTMLTAAVNDWGRQGLIGKPKKQGKTEQPRSDEDSADAQAARLAKNNRISQPQFAIYVHAVVEQADQDWREARATAAAQKKAYNQYRAYYRSRHGRAPYPQP